MFKIIVAGLGAEITQGFLPIDVVESIYEDMDEYTTLEDYLLESMSDPNKLDWYDIDDNFHDTGAYFLKSKVIIQDENGQTIQEINSNRCIKDEEVIDDLYADIELAVLTCIDESYGTFFESTVNKPFDLSQLKLKIKSLNTHSIIYDVEYDNQILTNEYSGSTLSKNFIASIES